MIVWFTAGVVLGVLLCAPFHLWSVHCLEIEKQAESDLNYQRGLVRGRVEGLRTGQDLHRAGIVYVGGEE